MKQKQFILILALVAFLSSCNNNEKESEQKDNQLAKATVLEESSSKLPEVIRLDKFKKTDFVLTLENPISDNINIIYAPAFLFAWDRIKKELKSQIIIDGKNSIDLKFLNQSNSFQNSLKADEYETKVEVQDKAIIAYAYFNKTLPFERKFHVFDAPIIFNKTKVKAFGMQYHDWEIVGSTQILYYKNDDNFILKLIPKDKQQEILLVKGLRNYKNLSDAVNQAKKLIEVGKQEKINSKISWKYEILDDDIFSIHQIKFNIETNYIALEGQIFNGHHT